MSANINSSITISSTRASRAYAKAEVNPEFEKTAREFIMRNFPNFEEEPICALNKYVEIRKRAEAKAKAEGRKISDGSRAAMDTITAILRAQTRFKRIKEAANVGVDNIVTGEEMAAEKESNSFDALMEGESASSIIEEQIVPEDGTHTVRVAWISRNVKTDRNGDVFTFLKLEEADGSYWFVRQYLKDKTFMGRTGKQYTRKGLVSTFVRIAINEGIRDKVRGLGWKELENMFVTCGMYFNTYTVTTEWWNKDAGKYTNDVSWFNTEAEYAFAMQRKQRNAEKTSPKREGEC